MTFDEIKKDPFGTIYVDRKEDGVRFVVVRGPHSLLAYLGIPNNHPYVSDDEIKVRKVEDAMDLEIDEWSRKEDYISRTLNCHGRVTFSGGHPSLAPKGWYYWGYDYGHAGDRMMINFPEGVDPSLGKGFFGDREWTPEEVEEDSKETIKQFKRIIKEFEYEKRAS